jgi:hypothetical protein
MLASGTVASTAGVMVSARGRGAGSLVAGMESSLATATLGSSPSQDKSVDFLQSTSLVVNQVRLLLGPGPSDYSWVIGAWLGLHAGELSKKYPVGLDPQECFAEVDEDRYMEDPPLGFKLRYSIP